MEYKYKIWFLKEKIYLNRSNSLCLSELIVINLGSGSLS